MIFVIAGIAIVIIAGLVVFFTSEDVQIGRRISTTQVSSIESYLQDCVEERVENKIKDLKIYGGEDGTYVPSTRFSYNGIPYNILLESNGRNNLNSRVTVQDILISDLRSYFDNGGCSLDSFRDNFVINEDRDNINIDIKISDSQINVDLVYPISVEKEELRTELERFNVVIDDNLGYILEPLVLGIINGYIQDEGFNVVTYCAIQEYYCHPDNDSGEKSIDIYRNKEDYEAGNTDNVFRFVVVT